MGYVGNEPTSNFASVTKDSFSGDGSTTAFTLSKASTTNGVAVFVENVRQEPTTAYAVSGTTLTFTAAPVSASGNNIYVLHHNAPASTATHPAAQDLTAVNGTMTGTLAVTGTSTFTGGLTINDGTTIAVDDNSDNLTLTSTDADANSGPNLNLYRNSGSPADNDVLGYLKFTGVNDNSEIINYARIRTDLTDASDGTEDGSFYIFAMNAGTERTRVSVVPSETVFNDESQDVDFRVESDNDTHAFFVEGNTGHVGIGGSNPDRMGSSNTSGVLTIESDSYAVLELFDGSSEGEGNLNTINFGFNNNTAANNGQVALIRAYTQGATTGHRGGRLSFFTKGNNASGLNEHLRLDNAGALTGTDTDGITSISDERLKKNIEDFTYSIDDFKKYKPKKFDWKHPDMHGGRSGQWGFSAQDVEKIDARFVNDYKVEDTKGIKDEDGNQIVHPDRQYLDADDIAKSSKLQQRDAMYISVIQQLIARIEALESK